MKLHGASKVFGSTYVGEGFKSIVGPFGCTGNLSQASRCKSGGESTAQATVHGLSALCLRSALRRMRPLNYLEIWGWGVCGQG